MQRGLGLHRTDVNHDKRGKPTAVRAFRPHVCPMTNTIEFPPSSLGACTTDAERVDFEAMRVRLRFCDTPQEVVDCLRQVTAPCVRNAIAGYRKGVRDSGNEARIGKLNKAEMAAAWRYAAQNDQEQGGKEFDDSMKQGYEAGQDASWNALAVLPYVSRLGHRHRPTPETMRLMATLSDKVVVAISDSQRDVFTVIRQVIADPNGGDGYDWQRFHLVDREEGPTLELTREAVKVMGELAKKISIGSLWTGCPGKPAIPLFHKKCIEFADPLYIQRIRQLDIVANEAPLPCAFRKVRRWVGRRLNSKYPVIKD
jgi:hypothetical protein